MSCAALTFLGAVIAHFSISLQTSEYLLGVLCVVFLFFAFSFEWIDEHKRLVVAADGHRATIQTYEETAADLRASVSHLQADIDQSYYKIMLLSQQLEKEINSKRPEVFASYQEDLAFIAMDVDSWNPSLRFHCDEGLTVKNNGVSAAYDISIDSVVSGNFLLTFSTLPFLKVGGEGQVEVFLENPSLVFNVNGDGSVSHLELVGDGGGHFSYEATNPLTAL